MLNVLITAGGTCEDIDSVRSISNHATGRLGSIIADTFAKVNAKITYVCGEMAALPACAEAEIVRIRNVRELLETMETMLYRQPYDCVIHSMAVSDFIPQAVITVDEIVGAVLEISQADSIPQDEMRDKIRTAVLQCGKPLTDKKISSQVSDIALLLKRAPKVIGRIKSIQPQTLLVGFKLLSGVSEQDLLQAGQNLLTRNACDFVLANDLEHIENDKHEAILMDQNGILHRANTKQEIAETILTYVLERIGV